MITIVGVGATGSHILYGLRNRKELIRIIDFDTIETKNVVSQLHSKMTLRRNKAVGTQLTYQGLWGLKIEAVSNRLNFDNVAQLLGSAKVVIDCVDNKATREIIQQFVRTKSIACLHVGVNAEGTFCRVVWDEVFVADQEVDGVPTCEDEARVAFFEMIGGFSALVASRYLGSGVKESYQITERAIVRVA